MAMKAKSLPSRINCVSLVNKMKGRLYAYKIHDFYCKVDE